MRGREREMEGGREGVGHLLESQPHTTYNPLYSLLTIDDHTSKVGVHDKTGKGSGDKCMILHTYSRAYIDHR